MTNISINLEKPKRYDELSEDAQLTAIMQVNNLNPIEVREKNLRDLADDYEYNSFGEILSDNEGERFQFSEVGAGEDPAYYESMLED